MKNTLRILFIVAAAVCMCAVMAGCGETNEKNSTVSQTSVEQSVKEESTTEEEPSEEEEFAGTTAEKASALAVSEAGENFRAVYAARKEYDDGSAWKIILADKDNSGLIAYVKGEECSFDTKNEEYFAGTTESGAVLLAVSKAGDGWKAVKTDMITYPNGYESLQVTLTNEENDTKIANVNDSECYFGQVNPDEIIPE